VLNRKGRREGGRGEGGGVLKRQYSRKLRFAVSEGLGLSHVTVSDGALGYRWIGREVLR